MLSKAPYYLIGTQSYVTSLLETIDPSAVDVYPAATTPHDAPYRDLMRATLSEPPQNLPEVLLRIVQKLRGNAGFILLTQYENRIRQTIFDLDGTLTPRETITDLAAMMQQQSLAHQLNQRAMLGIEDFRSNFTARVALLRGLTLSAIDLYARQIPFQPGAQETVQELQRNGVNCAIITGGSSLIASQCAQRLGISHYYATEFEHRHGALTGRFAGPIMDASGKASQLLTLCLEMGISPEECLAVGDGANDIPMLCQAGHLALGCYNPFPPLSQMLNCINKNGNHSSPSAQ